MASLAPYNVIAVLKHLVKMFALIGKSEGVSVSLADAPNRVMVQHDSATLVRGISDLLYKIINILPPDTDISIHVATNDAPEEPSLKIIIVNTGMCLAKVTELNNHLKFVVKPLHASEPGTSFETEFPVTETRPAHQPEIVLGHGAILPHFYAEIRKRLCFHFSKAEQLVANLSISNPREAAFLKKVNALILQNIGNPQMDANFISDALHMSRTQLFRRLKPIIRQSPGHYIKALRLQRAKEFLETTDLRINEVAFKTGFECPSHFTKAFVRHFGVKPSLFCRSKMQQMNK